MIPVMTANLSSQLVGGTDVDALVSGVYRCNVNLMNALVGSSLQGILEVYVSAYPGGRGFQRLTEVAATPRVWQRALTSLGWRDWQQIVGA